MTTLLNVGCGPGRVANLINTDKGELDITQPWPYGTATVDGITSMHVLCEIPWRPLTDALHQMYRVLKRDGVLRFGVPYVGSGKTLTELLGYGNIQLFSRDLWEGVLTMIGFEEIAFPGHHETYSRHHDITAADNRIDETLYVEAFKTKEGRVR